MTSTGGRFYYAPSVDSAGAEPPLVIRRGNRGDTRVVVDTQALQCQASPQWVIDRS
jgi:hypothetical protein